MKSGLTNNSIYAIFEDSQNQLWVGHDRGLQNLSSPELINYSYSNGLPADRVRCIKEDDQGNLWIGTYGQGIFMFDGNKFKKVLDPKGILEKAIVYDLEISENGTVWIGTFEQGLVNHNVQQNSFTMYSTEDGLTDLSIMGIKVETADKLYVSTLTGFHVLASDPESQKKFEIDAYSHESGFIPIECHQSSIYQDVNGNYWIGTLNGAFQFNSKAQNNVDSEALLKIESALLFFKSVDWKKEGSDFQDIPYNVSLAYDRNHLTFNYIGIYHRAPEKIRYSYKLEGLGSSWSPWSADRKITFSSLPPGTYEFQVRCKVIGSKKIAYSKALDFHINLPWWRTPWFYAICVILIALSIYGYFRIRFYRISQEKRKLQLLVNERTSSLNEALIEVKESSRKVMAGIKYAKTLQRAMVSSRIELKKQFEESFLLYEPKEDLSGDFVWIKEKDQAIYFAVADCTGHGVPGALLSILGTTILNTAISEKQLTKPGEILDYLSVNVRNTLEQEGDVDQENSINDGMEISLCKYDREKQLFYFAGARQNLVVVKNGTLDIIKGDKASVGKDIFEMEKKPYQSRQVSLDSVSMLYLSTDGFYHQIVEDRMRTMGQETFYNILRELSDETAEQQLKRLVEIKDDQDKRIFQTDDITVLGIKLPS